MLHLALRAAAPIALALVAAPAAAADWVSVGNGYWIDRDRITRDGHVAHFESAHDPDGPPRQTYRGERMAYHCVTHILYLVVDLQLLQIEPEPLMGARAELYSSILCR